jgi:hypothetical protein
MKNIDIEQLKKLAQAATPGTWAANPVFAQIDSLPSGVPVCQLLWPTELRSEDETLANGDFIVAANPSAILGLIETIEQLRSQNAAQQKRVEELESLAFAIADDATYDSEYDGRMYTYCAYCGEGQERGNDHSEDCPSLVARRLLGASWPREEVAEVDVFEIRRDAMIEKMRREKEGLRTRCKICNKKVATEGLDAHQRDNPHCLALSATAREG